MAENNIDRFLTGQNFGYEAALTEIRNKSKKGHWIWYVFPQLRGLGGSQNSIHYGISGTKEAEEFLAHPVLGRNLRKITEELLKCQRMAIEEILPSLDVLKVRSCMTLFDYISPNDIFGEVLSKFYKGTRDELTISILQKQG